jgi:hypothetical protein
MYGDPTCRFCRKEVETAQHIICCCEALACQRCNVFGSLAVELTDIRTAVCSYGATECGLGGVIRVAQCGVCRGIYGDGPWRGRDDDDGDDEGRRRRRRKKEEGRRIRRKEEEEGGGGGRKKK